MTLTRRQLKDLKDLRTKRGRREQGLFLAEGVRVVEEAVRFGVVPRAVYSAAASRTERGAELVRRLAEGGAAPIVLEDWQLASAADAETTQGILATFELPRADLNAQLRPDDRRVLICDGVADPGNLGTLLRSALAFSFSLVVLTGDAADPYAPKVVRSTAGALFGLRIARTSAREAVDRFRRESLTIVATSPSGDESALESLAVAEERIALAVGSEHAGLADEIAAAADIRWRLAHAPEVESLNAGVAGSIAMREVFRARESSAGASGDSSTLASSEDP